MSNNLLSFLRILVLLLGFAIICLGAFCISTDASVCKCNSLPIAYLLLPFGFFLLLLGIFWSTYHEASKHKSLFHSIMRGSSRCQDTHVNTIDRYVSVHLVSLWLCVSFFPFCFIYAVLLLFHSSCCPVILSTRPPFRVAFSLHFTTIPCAFVMYQTLLIFLLIIFLCTLFSNSKF